ncbi:MAG: adenylate/guanylate cyclase domain-containing protein [Reyranella sp.]|nr:adenylate/guanylate cyclase domain-containing protein [Reyranella sp.]
MTIDVNRAFAKLERRTERVVAVVRLLALCVLALVFWSLGALESRHAAAVPLGGFTIITLAGLVTARRSLYLPWIPWLLASLDVILLIHCLVDLAATTGQPLHLALDAPVALLIFVFLAAAAVRHRPLLILHTGGLFVVLWIATVLTMPLAGVGSWSAATFTDALGRLAIVGLVTFALFVAVTRARRTLTTSLTEARLRANLSRYFSPQLVDEIANSGNAARSFRPQRAAILFADLRGFTSLAETMPASRLADFLNDYRRRVSEPIVMNHGTIDKFIGDGVMAIFGVPEPRPDDARNAVLGGLAVVSAIEKWSAERLADELPSLRIGVGIHYGDVIAGPLGDENRLEFTAIGDTVNIAARIERLTADLGESILISADVLASASDLERDLAWVPLSAHFLRGRSQPVQIYRPDWNVKCALRSEPDEGSKATTPPTR